jgi:hypothetical protein
MAAEIIENVLILEGYLYYHSRYVGNNRRHWVCRRDRTKECNVRAITNVPEAGAPIIVYKGMERIPHETHPPNHNECKAEKIRLTTSFSITAN